ncbi:glycosyltransferase family 2 protein, partial [Brachyspira murdochii]
MNENLDKKPLVSILIPTFNRAMLLKRAVESVLKQDYHNIEIIISDNASEDNTTDIVNSFSSEIIKYIKREKNIGPVLNGIEGYKNVSGKYYMLLCDDDYLVSRTFISNAVEVME